MREAWWYGSVFRRDPCLIEDGVRGESKPLLQKPSFCRSGFRRDHCVIEDGGLGLKSYLNRSCDERKEVASVPLRSFRRHEPTDFRRDGFRREYSRIEERGVGIEGSPFGNDRRRRGDSGSGLKPLLPKKRSLQDRFGRRSMGRPGLRLG